jgi:hypothetical protein
VVQRNEAGLRARRAGERAGPEVETVGSGGLVLARPDGEQTVRQPHDKPAGFRGPPGGRVSRQRGGDRPTDQMKYM